MPKFDAGLLRRYILPTNDRFHKSYIIRSIQTNKKVALITDLRPHVVSR